MFYLNLLLVYPSEREIFSFVLKIHQYQEEVQTSHTGTARKERTRNRTNSWRSSCQTIYLQFEKECLLRHC